MKSDENALDSRHSICCSKSLRKSKRVVHTSQQLSILCLLSHMSELEIHLYTEHGASWLQKHLQYYKEGTKQVS